MKTHSLEHELIGLEKEYWNALLDKDVETAWTLTDDDCFIAGPQGACEIDKKDLMAMIRNSPYTIGKFEISDAKVHVITDDVAIVVYNVKEIINVDGEDLTIEAADSSTWVRKNGQWVCALHTESIKGDPFGRDRRFELDSGMVDEA